MASGRLSQVFKRPRRTAWMALRLLPADKAAIRTAARRVNKSMSAYFLALHRYATGTEKHDA